MLNKFPANFDEYLDVISQTYQIKPNTAFPLAEPKIFKSLFKLFTFFHSDAAVKRIKTSGWQRLRALYLGQVRRSLVAIEEGDLQTHFLSSIVDAKFNREFGQLPCTVKSISKRVRFIKERIPLDQPLLIIGDDDALSVALAKEGFTDLTIIDIDEKVVSGLKEVFKSFPNIKVDIRLHDVFLPLPEDLRKKYALATFDPWYALDGLDAFLTTAINSSPSSPPQILLSFNCGALLHDFESFIPTLNKLSYQVRSWYPLGNVYPVPRTLSLPIGLAERIWSMMFNFKKANSEMANGPQLFSSDILWLTPKSTDAAPTKSTLQ